MGLNDPLTICIGAFLAILLLMSLWARRDEVLYHLRILFVAALLGFAAFAFCMGKPEFQESAPFAALGMFGFVFMVRPKRKRRMRAKARRRAIAKWELKTGKKFNSRFHEIDHTVPFSQGGNETEDNLRVIDRKANRRKGAKSAWWDVLGRR